MNATIERNTHPSRMTQAIRWAARISSTASIGLLSLFVFGQNESLTPTLQEALGLALFPGLVALGMAAGWKWELGGGVASLSALAAFYLWHLGTSGTWPGGPYFALFTSPAALFIVAHLSFRKDAALGKRPAESPILKGSN